MNAANPARLILKRYIRMFQPSCHPAILPSCHPAILILVNMSAPDDLAFARKQSGKHFVILRRTKAGGKASRAGLKLIEKLRKQAAIVMDNATFHKRADTRKAAKDAGHIPEYLPPYPPDLNPTEHTWAQAKTVR